MASRVAWGASSSGSAPSASPSMSTVAPAGIAASARAASARAAGVGAGKLCASCTTSTVQPSARNPAIIRRSYTYPPVRVSRSPGTTTVRSDTGVVRGARDVGFVQRDAEAGDAARRCAEIAAANRVRDAVEDDAREKLGRRIATLELEHLVEVSVVQPREHRLQHVARAADVDDDAVGVELAAPELEIDDVGGAVQALRGTERLAREAVGDHDVIADRDAVHQYLIR